MPFRFQFQKIMAVSAVSALMAGISVSPARAVDVGFAFMSLENPAISAVVAGNRNLEFVADKTDMGEGSKSFIDSMAQRGLGFLVDEKLSTDAKASKFKDLLEDSFDMNTIARFALGRYWRTASDAQKKEYMDLFKKMIVTVYTARFNDYEGQKFETRSVRQDGDKDAIVSSFLVPDNGSEVQIDWRVRKKNGSYQVIDVMVEGVSMSVTQRSDFSSVIQRGGGNIDVLLEHLRQQAAAGTSK